MRSGYVAVLALLIGLGPVGAAPRNDTDEARRVAAKLDEYINAGYARAGVKPAPLASDAGFLRRVSLDVIGRVPAVSDVRKFLRDPSPERRAKAVEALLDSPAYVNNMTQMWLDLLLPEAKSDLQRRYLLVTMDRWLRNHFAKNTPYDRVVREIVAMPLANRDTMRDYNAAFGGGGEATPVSFYLAKGNKADEIAASVARTFLGVRLECAQCHDHPFGKWKREEFWSQAAFFAGIRGPREPFGGGTLNELSDRREMIIPNTDRVAQARFLDGKAPKWKFRTSARTTLADWMTTKDNPLFAKALVNRMWAHFFGIGLVDPVDDIVDDNPPSHPELLDYLAKQFADHDFDLKFLIKAIVLSRTYQLASSQEGAASDVRLFARMPVKGLTGEQLYDSIGVATGVRDNQPLRNRIFSFGTPRQAFMEQFTDQEKRTEYHTAIPQALTMMNSELINNATNPDRGQLLGAIVDAPFLKAEGKIEALFLAALSRKPTAKEASKYLSYVQKGGTKASERKALGDVFWALLNSTEFLFNH